MSRERLRVVDDVLTWKDPPGLRVICPAARMVLCYFLNEGQTFLAMTTMTTPSFGEIERETRIGGYGQIEKGER